MYHRSRPPELVLSLFTLTRFHHLACIAHKYQFQSIETWTLTALTAYVNANASFLQTFDWGYPTNLVHLTEVANLCEHFDLLAAVTTQWKSCIRDGKELGRAIDMTERLGLKSLLGLAYHAMTLKDWRSDPFITRSRHVRLLSGYHALTKMCDALPSQPPTLSHGTWCLLPQVCASSWNDLWQSIMSGKGGGLSVKVPDLQSSDLVGRVMLAESVLKALVQEHSSTSKFRGMHSACTKKMHEVVAQKVKEVEESLADLFSGAD
jgi:hypothetical protein